MSLRTCHLERCSAWKPAPPTSSQPAGWIRCHQGHRVAGKTDERCRNPLVCTPLVWCTTGVELGIIAAGLVVASAAASRMRAAGTP
jgi:hypothetical protein